MKKFGLGERMSTITTILALRYHSFSEICFNYDELLDELELEPDEPPELPEPFPLPESFPFPLPLQIVTVKLTHQPPLISSNSQSENHL